MALDVLNPVSLKKLKGIGGFTYVDDEFIDNENFWLATIDGFGGIETGVGVWEELTPGGFSINDQGVAVYDDHMYFLYYNGSDITTLTKYNFATEAYTDVTLSGYTMPKEINYGYCSYGENMYIYGGNWYATNTRFSRQFYHINLATGFVTELPHHPQGSVTSAPYAFRRTLQMIHDPATDIIYMIGGAYDSDPTWEDVKSTDWMLRWQIGGTPTTGSWLGNVQLDVKRQEHSSYLLNGIIYNVGGTYGTSVNRFPTANVESYNTNTGQIISGAASPLDYPIPIGDHSWVAYKGRAFVLGGETTSDVSVNDVRQYNPSTNLWTNTTQPPVSFSWGEAAEYGDSFYIYGANSFWKFRSLVNHNFVVERIY